MTRYFTKMRLKLLEAQLQCAYPARYFPSGFDVVRIIRIDGDLVEVEVEDEGADPAIEGSTVLPWFQLTLDGECVIIEREVLLNEHDQIRVEAP